LVWHAASVLEQVVMQLASHVEVQFALQLKLPGLAVHSAMQLAPHEPVHITLPVAVHCPSHSAATLTGVH
jgi:hypothetical protein